MTADPPSTEALLEHNEWCRRLARQLVRDTDRAEDVVQDAWVSILRAPPAHAGDLRPWLAQVLRNAARRLRRVELARLARERHLAGVLRAAPSDEELHGALDAQRKIVECVLSLEEPYRRTVILRYWQDLALKDIARQEAVPVATVKTRLRRAVARLRERLDAAYQSERRRALPGLCALAYRPVSRCMSLGGVLVAKKALVCALGVIMCLVVATVWRQLPPRSNPHSLQVDPDGLGEIGRAPVTDASEHVRVVEPPPPDGGPTVSEFSQAGPPQTLSIFGLVLPGEGRTSLTEIPFLSFTDSRGAVVRSQADLSGSYSIGGLLEGPYWISAGSFHDGEARAVVVLEPNTPERRLDLQLQLPQEIRVKLIDSAGKPIGVLGRRILPVATLAPPGDWLDEADGSPNERVGVGNFWDDSFFFPDERLPPEYYGRLRLQVPPPVYISLLHNTRVLETKRVEEGAQEVEFVIDREAPTLQVGSVSFGFRATDTGEMLRASWVRLERQGGGLFLRGEGGLFQASAIAPGLYSIEATIEGYEPPRLFGLRIQPGEHADLGIVELQRGTSIAGRVVDDRGVGLALPMSIRPYQGATQLEWRSSEVRKYASAADGSFRIEGLSHGEYLLRVGGGGGPWGSLALPVDTSAGPIEELRVELVPGVPLVVRGSDERWPTVHYRVLDARGVLVARCRMQDPAPARTLLCPGVYRVETSFLEGGDPVRVDAITIGDSPVELQLP